VKLLVEPSRDVPLVWYHISAVGGAASDAAGCEGLTRSAAELARRGAGARTRAQLDLALDELGASLHVSTSRDHIAFNGLCLARNLDATLAIVEDVLAAPTMSAAELTKLLVDTHALLDEARDDDGALAQRYFVRDWAGDHPYCRTALGTATSLDAMAPRLDSLRARFRELVVPDNLIVGFAGDIDEQRATQLAERLVARLPTTAAPALIKIPTPQPPPRRRAVLVDKPERTQVEVMIGHPAPHVDTRDFDALTLIETVFGGTFTSRLMQEIRVKHGWTYGASCRLGRARGPLWFRIGFASATETVPAAVARTLEMYEQLADEGITAQELDFAHGYLAGSWPFSIATARARLRVRMDAALYGLPDDFIEVWPQRLAAVTLEDTRRAARLWLLPTQTLTTLVGTAADLQPRLADTGVGTLEVIPYDAY